MRSAFLFALLWAAPASAQFQLFVVDTLSERPVGAVQDLGSVARGDTANTRFRLRNAGTAAAAVRSLEVAGSGYAFQAQPALPQTVAAGASLDFTITFRASTEGVYSAVLRSEGVSAFLTTTVVAQLTLAQVVGLGSQPLAAGAVIAFGSVERGSGATVRLLLQNQTAIDQVTPPVQIVGDDFAIPAPPAGQLLRPLEQVGFDVTFTPSANGLRTATLTAGSRSFILQGTGIEPALPKPAINATLSEAHSAQQGQITVSLPEKARTGGTGTVTLAFAAAVLGATDPAIQFASGGRTAAFSFATGDDRVSFGLQPSVGFQTGTTAGTLTLTAQIGAAISQQVLTIAAAPVSLSTVAGTRSASSVEVRVTGYDNARSAGPLTFTFYDKAGVPIPPGAIRTDSAAEFTRYFATTDLGGQFLLRATFPVTGEATGIDAVEVEMGNSKGSVKSERVKVQ